MDAFHDGEEVRFRRLDDIIGGTGSSGLAGQLLNDPKLLLVTRGFVQREGIDFEEVFALVARMESVQLLLALTTAKDWRIHHLDIKSAFLNGELVETVFVRQPSGFTIKGEEHRVLRLRKALYGLRQAP